MRVTTETHFAVLFRMGVGMRAILGNMMSYRSTRSSGSSNVTDADSLHVTCMSNARGRNLSLLGCCRLLSATSLLLFPYFKSARPANLATV